MNVFSILLAIGLVLIAVSLALAFSEHRFISRGTVADGTVVENVRRAGSRRSGYTPKVAFKTRQGKEVVFMPTFSSNPPAYKPGDAVKVVYQGEGQSVRILSFALRFGVAWAIFGAGLALILIAAGFRYGDELFIRHYLGSSLTFPR